MQNRLSTIFGTDLSKEGKAGLTADDLCSLVVSAVNEVFNADWRTLFAILARLSGLGTRELARCLGVGTSTINRWRRGAAIPRSNHFPAIAARLEELTGISRAVIEAARETSLIKSKGGLVPRPAWARQYDEWELALSYYLTRLTENLTYQQVATLVGYPAEKWVQWAKGQRVPRKWQLRKVWRIVAVPQGVLWAELLAARNRGARIIQARNWRHIREARAAARLRTAECHILQAFRSGASSDRVYEEVKELFGMPRDMFPLILECEREVAAEKN